MLMGKDNNTSMYYGQYQTVFDLNDTDTYADTMTMLRKNLENEMKLRDWNAYDLSEKSGVPQPTIQRFLAGKIGDPRGSTVIKLAKGLGISEAKLRGFANDKAINNADSKTTPQKTLESIFSGSNLTLSASIKIVKMPFFLWSDFCKSANSINKIKELDIMAIDNGIEVSEEIYAIDLDTNTFKEFPVGVRILIDPKKTPEKNSTVVLSIDDGIPTLVRWNPGLGLLQVEPLESGYPNSISLEGKNYTVLGVAVWQHTKGGAL